MYLLGIMGPGISDKNKRLILLSVFQLRDGHCIIIALTKLLYFICRTSIYVITKYLDPHTSCLKQIAWRAER